MRKISARRGSALLVVLGMLAFMTVSAIAFAAYMRRARLPSNYLRRATSSRELVKAALARAIDDIDHAVNDNPHPGLGSEVCTRANTNCNGWIGRVFMNTNMTSAGKTDDGLVDPSNTVSVLSLEGLAYVPAPLMGEARYYGRRTPTAQWQSFDFDAGRYAYLALDVSDYLDVNRLFAGKPRSSAANTRITLSYLFDKVEEGEDWDKLLEGNVRDVDNDLNITFNSKPPLTSVADLSLALVTGSCGPFKSWFHEYLEGKGQLTRPSKDADSENPLLMPLVTDGWFPTNDIHKADDAYAGAWNGSDFAAGDIPNSLDSLFRDYKDSIWNSYLGLVGFAALCDYLDPDRVPTSLAIPTVERAPMICGFQMQPMQGKVQLERDPVIERQLNGPTGPPTNANDKRDFEATITYKLKLDQLLQTPGGVRAIAAFPFAHKDENDTSNWKVDGRFAFFFTDGEPSLRTGKPDDGVLHLAGKDIDSKLTDEGVMSMKMNDTGVTFSAPTAGDPLQGTVNDNVVLNFNGTQVADDLLKSAFLTVKYTWTQIPQRPNLGEGNFTWGPVFADVEKDFSTYSVNAKVNAKFEITLGLPILDAYGKIKYDKQSVVSTDPDSLPLGNLQLNAAVWLRVLDKDGNVVDMVPACVDDDKIQNPNMAGSDEHTDDDLRAAFGQPYPLMLLNTDPDPSKPGAAKISLTDLTSLNNLCDPGGVEVKVSDKAYFVADPRYNYAPENWFQSERNSCTREDWIKENGGAFGNSGNDIFFATSDAGYLQSPYELANLPRVTKLGPGNGIRGELEIPDGETRTSLPTSPCHKERFWKNYDPMLNDPINLESNLLFHASYQGQKVNPYTDNIEVLRGVFANTPLDWKRASTNFLGGTSECAGNYYGDVVGLRKNYTYGDVTDFNAKYTWSDANTQESAAQISRDVLESFADKFRQEVRNNYASKPWDEILADLMNDAEPNMLGGIDLGNARLYKADREFLYGFWRECFAVRQQLFLVFVRAEPLMMGGAAAGATPPQLGGRAVALVWRDPNAVGNTGTDCTGYPHQTRVLFYKNLE